MRFTAITRALLRSWAGLTLVFLYLPLVVIAILSFNEAASVGWPPTGLTTRWWRDTFAAEAPMRALRTSLQVAALATALALVLGTMAALAMRRYSFFGKDAVSFLFVLPIALPGIVTGVALKNAFGRTTNFGLFELNIGLGFTAVVIAHSTFCVVIAYNNVIARLRRSSPNLLEASADLGANSWQTFRHVTFPLMRSALFAGGLLAFALSFDEIVVTQFTAGAGVQTLPMWMYANFSRPNLIPQVNVMATFVMLVSIPAAWLAQRLSD